MSYSQTNTALSKACVPFFTKCSKLFSSEPKNTDDQSTQKVLGYQQSKVGSKVASSSQSQANKNQKIKKHPKPKPNQHISSLTFKP